jgi:16S rRNA C1402 (ribose-2'-O) methylase RsmI
MAGELVRDHGEKKVLAQIEHLDWLVETKPGNVADPAAWLVAAIRNGHATPKGFVSKAERQRREEARQAQEREKAEQRRRQREQAARDRAVLKEVDAYLKRLIPAERKVLEAEALARAGAEARQGYEEAALARFRSSVLLGLMREHVAQEFLRGAIPAED